MSNYEWDEDIDKPNQDEIDYLDYVQSELDKLEAERGQY